MARRKAQVNIELNGANKVRKGLRDIVSDGVKASQKSQAAAKKQADTAAKDAKRSAEAQKRETQKLADFQQKAALSGSKLQVNLDRDAQRSKERTLAAQVRASEKASQQEARARTRELNRVSREEQKSATQRARDSWESTKKYRLMALGGAIGAGAAIASRASAYAGAVGMQSPEAMLQKAVEAHTSWSQTAGEANLSKEQSDAGWKQVLAASQGSGIDATEVLGGLQHGQGKFDSLQGLLDALPELTKMARASNTPIGDLIDHLSEMKRQFNLTDQEMMANGMSAMEKGNRGGIPMRGLAADFGGTIGPLARLAGMKGAAGANRTEDLMQIVGMGGGDPAENATALTRVWGVLQDPKTQARLAASKAKHGFGFNVTKSGKFGTALKDPLDIIRGLMAGGFDDPNRGGDRFAAFKGKGGRQVVNDVGALAATLHNHKDKVDAVLGGSAEGGQEFVDRTFKDVTSGPLGELSMMATKQFAEFAGNANEVATAVKSLVGPVAEFTAAHPLLTEALRVLAAAVGAAGATAVLKGGIAGIGGGGAAAAATGGAAIAGGEVAAGGLVTAGAGAVGGLGMAGTVGLGAAGIAALLAVIDGAKKASDVHPDRSAAQAEMDRLKNSPTFARSAAHHGGGANVVRLDDHSIERVAARVGSQVARNMPPSDARRNPGGPAARM